MKDKSIKIAIALFLIIAVYFLFYLPIHIKAEEQDFKTFEVVNGLVGLLLTAVASIFVYNTYKVQREQINIQKGEIARNQKDIEFNRILDLFYKQIEYSEKRLNINVKLAEEINRFYKGVYIQTKDLDIEYTNEGIQLLSSYLKVITHIRRDLEVYHRILISSNLCDDKKKFIVDISIENIYPDLRIITKNFYKLLLEFKLSGTYRNCEIEQNNESNLVIDIVENIEDNLEKINAMLFMKPFEEI